MSSPAPAANQEAAPGGPGEFQAAPACLKAGTGEGKVGDRGPEREGAAGRAMRSPPGQRRPLEKEREEMLRLPMGAALSASGLSMMQPTVETSDELGKDSGFLGRKEFQK
ncbi:uncharacterized protein LOC143837116 isoform X4 [Paroedura picta]|uniref:uncharacterized protein LOC143837116 isoform X4 n=1 Tax=Paroedura picta TaxID=143630 RepID=UPI0040573F5E